MRLVLQEKIVNLGNVGDQVKVKAGYARNYLLPKGMAVVATAENIADFEKRRVELDRIAAEKLAQAQARADKLKELVILIESQASEEGKLYGSVGPRDVAEAAVKQGVEIEKREVSLPEGPIRNIGEFDVVVHLHSDVEATVKVHVKSVE